MSFELNGGFHKKNKEFGDVAQFVLGVCESDSITSIMEATRTYVATCTLKCVRLLLNFIVVITIHTIGYFFHANVQ